MADKNHPSDKPQVRVTGDRRAWSAPRLLEYGHIGKLTQGASGTMSDDLAARKNCL
jgi:hypothetical protein